MGFAGTDFSMRINDEYYKLFGPTIDSDNGAKEAIKKAKDILIERFNEDFGVEEMKFAWDGTM